MPRAPCKRRCRNCDGALLHARLGVERCPHYAIDATLQCLRIRAGPAVSRVEICTKKHCKKKGSLKMLRIFEALAPDGVEVLTADMSHTEHGCFDECTMGPNVRVDGAGPKADGGPIVNGVRGAAGAAEVLGIDVPEGWELPN